MRSKARCARYNASSYVAEAGDDTLTVSTQRNDINLEIHEAWAGDTETGFGRTAQIRISHEQSKQLLSFLASALNLNIQDPSQTHAPGVSECPS